MDIKVLYSVHYFERDLFVIEINGKRTMVYRGSGLNGGRKGRILPFMFLNTRRTIRGPILGYIFKEFYYEGQFINHHKEPEYFNGVPQILEEIEKTLERQQPKIIEQNMEDIEEIATEINTQLYKHMGNDKSLYYDFKN